MYLVKKKNLLLAITMALCDFLCLASAKNENYCDVKCDEGVHTMCKYKPCDKMASNCAQDAKIITTSKMRELYVKAHNKWRNKLALGEIKNHPQGSNIMEISYNEEIEKIAACHARQCMQGHDKCRNTLKGESVGQNYAWKARSSSPFNAESEEFIESIVDDWASELKVMEKSYISKFSFESQNIGHWTQMIWAKTTAIGCATLTQYEKNMYSATVLCNYVPAGNFLGNEIYKTGKPCSACPNNLRCSKEFKGLCGNFHSRELEQDTQQELISKKTSGARYYAHQTYAIMIFSTMFGFIAQYVH